MFGFGAYRKYEQGKKDHATLPHREVSHEEFVRLAIADGVAPDKAESLAKISEGLGSQTKVGNEILSIPSKRA